MAIAKLSIDLEAKLSNIEQSMAKLERLNRETAGKIESTWAKAQTTFQGFGAGVAAATASLAALGGVAVVFKNQINALDALNDLSDATGSTVDMLAGLEDVIKRTGGSLDEVGGVLVKFNGILKEADPDSPTAAALKQIGLSAKELRELDPTTALQQTAKALSNYADDGNKARVVQNLFGKSVKEAAPILKDLADASDINGIKMKEAAEQAEKFNKNIAAFETNAASFSRGILDGILPNLNTFIGRLVDASKAYNGLQNVFINGGGGLFSLFDNDAIDKTQKKLAELELQRSKIGRDILSRSDSFLGNFQNALDKDTLETINNDIETTKRVLNSLTELNKLDVLRNKDDSSSGNTKVITNTGGGGSSKSNNRVNEFEQQLKRLQDMLEKQQRLTELEKLSVTYAQAKVGFTEAQKKKLNELAAQVDLESSKKELQALRERLGLQDKVNVREQLMKDIAEKRLKVSEEELNVMLAKADKLDKGNPWEVGPAIPQNSLTFINMQRLNELTENLPGNAIKADMQIVSDAFDDGRISAEQFTVTMQKLKDSLEKSQIEFDPFAQMRERVKAMSSTTEAARTAELIKQQKEIMEVASQDGWTTEFVQAWDERAKQIMEINQKLKTDFEVFADQAARNIQDALGDSIVSMFNESSKSLLDIWSDMLKKMAAQALAAQLSEKLVGKDGKAGAGSLIGDLAGWVKTLFNENGNVFGSDGVIPFANGGIVSQATPFTFGGGKLGVMGEAGPEAILPVKRGKDGKLGVISSNNGGAVVINSSLTYHGSNRAEFEQMLNARDKQIKADILRSRRMGGAFA